MPEKSPKSKYLISNRLEDVLAGIQMLASERSGKKEASEWARKFSRGPSSVNCPSAEDCAQGWATVFSEHPEFFIVEKDDDGKVRASLLLRRSAEKAYDLKQLKELTEVEIAALNLPKNEFNDRFVRRALSPDQIQTLISAAILLHERAISLNAERRWRLTLALPLLSGILGALLGAVAVVFAALLKK